MPLPKSFLDYLVMELFSCLMDALAWVKGIRNAEQST